MGVLLTEYQKRTDERNETERVADVEELWTQIRIQEKMQTTFKSCQGRNG